MSNPSDPRSPAAQAERSWLDLLPWFFILLGCVMRVLWPLDMEWKYDEQWMFDKALAIADGRTPWPWIGMASGVGLHNPGLSIWPFALIAHVTDDPVVATQIVQWINVLGVCGYALWVHKTWQPEDRALGLWGTALYAVSPLSVLFSRKMWAQDLLIVFVLPWLWGQRERKRAWGAGLWGLCGALLGQVHMSGFFAAAALFAVTLWTDRGRFHVRAWLVGSLLGALPLIPWLAFLLSPEAQSAGHGSFSLQFFTEALRHAWGLGLEYPIGRAYRQLLRGPEVAGVATHLAAAARYGLLALLALAVALRVREGLRTRLPEPVLTYGGCVLLAGLLLCAARVHMFAHYLIVFGPMLHIVAAWTLLSRRWAVLALCGLQAFLTACFLVFIHVRGGAPNADYGKTYRMQTAEERAFQPRD